MNEITKLYENANVEKHLAYFECHRGRSSFRKCPICYDERDDGCFYCSCENKMNEIYEYPPFTAEKQIELIKILSKYESTIENIDGEFEFSILDIFGDINFSFEEGLAQIINIIWENLSKEEKKQIKEILE